MKTGASVLVFGVFGVFGFGVFGVKIEGSA